MKADIAVVGGGLTALIAARTIQQAGRQPLLIWPGLSSLYFVFATIDVLGYRDGGAAADDPGAAVASLIAADAAHPYGLAGLDALRDGVALIGGWLEAAGMHWRGDLGHNFLLPTAIGASKPACLVPQSMAAGDLRGREPIVLCGFAGYDDFVPELAASNLSAAFGSQPPMVRAIRVELPGFDPGRLFTSIDLARAFEADDFQDAVAERIERCRLEDGARLGLPAVLGMTRHDEVHARFQQATGHPVFEIATLPPSVAGLRLFDRLRKHLQEDGVEFVLGAPAHAAEVGSGRCLRIMVKAAGREHPIEAKAYVLALEDAVDGAWKAGIHAARDPFFGQTLATSAMPGERSEGSLLKPQPFARYGYSVNDRLQPVGPDHRPLADNVFVAGGAIAGYDPVGTRSRGGLAIATGYRAAKEATRA